MPSAYYPQIVIYVDTNFTDALGYSAAQRLTLSNWLDATIVPIVNVNFVALEKDKAVEQAINASQYANTYGATRTALELACEFTIDLVIQANATGFPSGVKVYYMSWGQNGANPLQIVNTFQNDLGALVTMSYDAVGDYGVSFPTNIMPDPTKVAIEVESTTTLVPRNVFGSYVAANKIQVHTQDLSCAAAPGPVVSAQADGVNASGLLKITVYP